MTLIFFAKMQFCSVRNNSSILVVKRRIRMAAGQKISTHKNSALAFKSGENGVNFQLVSVHLLYLYLGLTSFCWVSDVVQLRIDKKVSYLVLTYRVTQIKLPFFELP